MKAIIYKEEKSPMQSAIANTKSWTLEYGPEIINENSKNIMGWHGGYDTRQQVKLKFSSKSAAIVFVENNNMDYKIEEPHKKRIKPKNYMDNFKFMPLE